MNDGSRQPARAGWPLGLVGMLAIVVATERYIAHRPADLGTMYSLEWNGTGHAISRNAAAAKLHCYGTSLTRLGVSPKIIHEKTGLPSYNFALSGGQPYASYTALRKALRMGSKPEALVVDFKWSAIATPSTWNERVLPEVASLAECAELALATNDWNYLARITLVRELPSYRCRTEIRANILAAVRGLEPKRNWERLTMNRNAAANLGATHTPRGNYDGSIKADDPSLFPVDWKCDPISELYIDKFMELAASRNIQVYWLLHPIAPAAQARREALGSDEAYTRFVKAVVARHPEVSVVDARRSGFGNEAFFDTTHLNRDGAVAFSDELGRAIRARRETTGSDQPYWVSLPPYRKATETARVEDLSETLAAMTSETKAKNEAKLVR